MLRVTDNGPGIPDREAERVFDRYYRGEAGGTPRVTGSGLGLYLARLIIEAHRGAIRLVPLGEGACFEITLPRKGIS